MALFGQKAPKGTGMMTSLGFPGLSSQSVSGFYLSAKVVGQCGTQFLVCLCLFVQVRTSFRICSFKRVLFCQGILSSTSMLAAENTEETNHQAGVLGAGGLRWQLSYRLALPGSIQRGTKGPPKPALLKRTRLRCVHMTTSIRSVFNAQVSIEMQ